MNKKYISWQELDSLIDKFLENPDLYDEEDGSCLYESIYAIPRGGLVIGVLLSHRLGIPMIFDRDKTNDATLVVDEICDSGKTLDEIHSKMKWCDTAVIHHRRGCKTWPTFFVEEVEQNIHIVYPWEKQ